MWLAEQNPAAAFRPADILKQRVTTNFARVDASELPNLLKKIDRRVAFCANRIADDGARVRAYWRVDSCTVVGVRPPREAVERTGRTDEDETSSSGSAFTPGPRRFGGTLGTQKE
jgi:hypothetical protein